MSITTPKDGLVAVAKNSGVKPLGHIVWWFLPDGDLPLRTLRTEWEKAGLDPRPLPKDTRDSDLYRRAIRGEEGRKENHDGLIIETDVRDIPTNDSYITYQVSRVIKDAANVMVEYPRALTTRYDRFTSEITFSKQADDGVAEAMIESIKERYAKNQRTITANRLRSLIREFLVNDADDKAGIGGLSAESMRPSGGVYFVLDRHAKALEALGEFFSAMYPDGDAQLCSLPMADGASEREMVRRSHVANSIAEIEAAITDGRNLLQDRKRAMSDSTRQHHFQKLARLQRHAADYAQALQDEQADVTSHLTLLSKQLDKLLAA